MALFKKVIFALIVISLSGCLISHRLYKRTKVLMGTFVEIQADSPQVVDFAFSFMEKLSKKLDGYYLDSDIYRLNKNAGYRAVKVSPQTIEILRLSRQLYSLTQGTFDISGGRIIRFWKDMMRKERLKEFPSRQKIKELLSYKGMDSIEIDSKNSKVFIKSKDITIDLGGIAKGYIVDKTVEALRKKGISSVLINAGGDIYCLGNNPQTGKPWKVGIRNPQNPRQVVNIIPLSNAAIATSGDSEQFFTYDSRIYSHIINLKTGMPIEKKEFMSVSVIAPNLTTADGLATFFFILGRRKIPLFLAKHHSNFKVFVIIPKETGMHIYQYGSGF